MAGRRRAVVRNEALKPERTGRHVETAGAPEPKAAMAAAAQQIGLLLFNADITSAMDRVERATGTHRFVIFGACSDAANAFQAALEDERVIGIATFDGFCHCSRWTSVVRTWKRLRTTPWRDLFDPLREGLLRQARELVARDVRIYFICDGSIIGHVSCPKQLGDIEIRLLEQLDHAIISLDVQKQVCEIVDEGWVGWPAEAADRTTVPSQASLVDTAVGGHRDAADWTVETATPATARCSRLPCGTFTNFAGS